ncbi:MAG TPA: rhamnulokinase family protein [Streptosporangiaceae bacterium]
MRGSSGVLVAAADLGASSGRVMLARVGPGRASLHEVHRFPNAAVRAAGTLHWDILGLYREVLAGAAAASRAAQSAGGALASVGIDSWGVDYGLLDGSGALLGNPVHYRDDRTAGVPERVWSRVSEADLYAVTGIQQLPFNTIYQLAAAAETPQLAAARTMLLIPDLLAYWLTGETGAERTNASTTQLYDARRGEWARELIERAGIPASLFPPLRSPGELIGPVQAVVSEAAGLPAGLPVIAAASHDTASAVAAVPARGRDFAYISTGTWSLVGMELDTPVLTAASREAGFTNEAGLDGRIRYLHNVTGLWLLQESLRGWAAAGRQVPLDGLLAEAAWRPPLMSVVDPDDPVFLPPGDMPARLAAACRRAGDPVPGTPAEVARCILDSLALAYRRTVIAAQELSGRTASVIHMVGGGIRNQLLCQLTADACGRPVIAGPVEAAAWGNALVQARALGAAPGDLDGLRALLRGTQELRRFEPSGDQRPWAAAARRLGGPG